MPVVKEHISSALEYRLPGRGLIEKGEECLSMGYGIAPDLLLPGLDKCQINVPDIAGDYKRFIIRTIL